MQIVETVTGGSGGSIGVWTDGSCFELKDNADGMCIERGPNNQTAAIARATALVNAGLANSATFWTGSVLEVVTSRRGYVIKRQDSGAVLESFHTSPDAGAAAIAKAQAREASGNTF